jgi:hypothetical protein
MKTKDNKKKFDSKKYVANLGKTGMFYNDRKNSKGTEGVLVSVAKDCVYAKTKGSLFPQAFQRAEFGGTGNFKCSCGKTFKMVEVNEDKSSKSKKSKGSKDSYGSFSGDGRKKSKALTSFADLIEDLNYEDDDDYEKMVEASKKLAKVLSK